MATVKGTVEAANNPNQWGKYSMSVNGEWYSTNPAWLKEHPEAGDEVEFDNGGKKYIKNLKVLSTGGGSVATKSFTKGVKPYSNLGVELGHASNIAKDIVNTYCLTEVHGERVQEIIPGDDEWYKAWIKHTQKVYETMSAIRNKYEHIGETTAPSDKPVVMRVKKPSIEDTPPAADDMMDDLSDIFGT